MEIALSDKYGASQHLPCIVGMLLRLGLELRPEKRI